MPTAIGELAREMLHDPAMINLQRQAAPATGITQAVYPVPQHLKPALLLALVSKLVLVVTSAEPVIRVGTAFLAGEVTAMVLLAIVGTVVHWRGRT